jgi:hypothetical protein
MHGCDLYSVSQVLGHQDLKTTARYAHLSPAHLRETVNRGSLGDLLHAGTGSVVKTVASQAGEREEERQPVDYMVRPEGLEPPTLGSEVRCSIH